MPLLHTPDNHDYSRDTKDSPMSQYVNKRLRIELAVSDLNVV